MGAADRRQEPFEMPAECVPANPAKSLLSECSWMFIHDHVYKKTLVESDSYMDVKRKSHAFKSPWLGMINLKTN